MVANEHELRREAFVQVLPHLREPVLLVARDAMVVAGNVAAAEALDSSVAALEGAPLESFCVDPGPLAERVRRVAQDGGSFPLRTRDDRRYSCDASVLAPDLYIVRLSGGPDESKRARAFFEMLPRLERLGSDGRTRSVEELSRTLLKLGMEPVGSQVGGVFLLDEDGRTLELTGSIGYPQDTVDGFRLVAMANHIPLTDSVRLATPIYLATVEDYRESYPAFTEAYPAIVRNGMACIPLVHEGRCIGTMGLGFISPFQFRDSDRAFLREFAPEAAQALSRAIQEDAEYDLDPQRRASRFERLHAFTAALARAITPADVAEAALDASMAATSARSGGLWLVDDDGTTATLVRSVGTGPRPENNIRVPLDAPRCLPILEAIRTGAPVWIESSRQFEVRYPEVFRPSGETSLACVPLLAHGKCIGGLAYRYDYAHRFLEHERAFFQVLTWYAAQALERSRLHAADKLAREAAEARHRRAAFLAESDTLLSSLDYETTLAAIATAAVPRIADWCIVELEDDRRRGIPATAAHADPAKVPFVLALSRKFRERGDAGHGIPEVIRTGKPLLYKSLAPEDIRATVSDRELAELFLQSGVVSTMIVPISARGRTLGAMLLNSANPARRYDELDLAMVDELGRKIGLALENARLYREARENDRLKDEFLAMLSHELRNPLVPIVAAVDLMGLQNAEMYTQERELIRRNARHLVRLVDDLLDVSRITRGKIQLKKEPCEVADLITEALDIANPLIEDRVQRLALAVPRQGLPVLTDRVRIAQAIANLLTNAAKYTDRGGTIVVTARIEGKDVTISVLDSGIGIAPEFLPRIFDLFVQATGQFDRAQGGLGIGLTVVKRLVELHDGSVIARSPGLGFGSEFVIRLPLGPFLALPAPSAQVEPVSIFKGKRVLVVDDNHDAAAVISELMHAVGFTTRIAHDGMAALAAAVDFKPDLALLDLGLPSMDGYELGRRLRILFQSLRIVAVTGYAQETDRARSQEAGFDEHIVKPVDLATLRQIVANMRLMTSES